MSQSNYSMIARSRRTVRRRPRRGVAPVAVSARGTRELDKILDDVLKFVTRYVSLPTAEAGHAIALWILHTYLIEAFSYTPRLALLSKHRGSGKSRCLAVLRCLVNNPHSTFNTSIAALFRTIDTEAATVLLDECDTYLGPTSARFHEDHRGLVNAGFERGVNVTRCEKQNGVQVVVSFKAFAPIALAGLDHLPDTIMDRSIVVGMRPRRSSERIEKFTVAKSNPPLKICADA
jgi:hypothetical protein